MLQVRDRRTIMVGEIAATAVRAIFIKNATSRDSFHRGARRGVRESREG
jgi:hypothetical protein